MDGLPTHYSHLNPVEPIWRRLKDKVAANRLHGSMSQLLTTVAEFFSEMTPEQALHWAGSIVEGPFHYLLRPIGRVGGGAVNEETRTCECTRTRWTSSWRCRAP